MIETTMPVSKLLSLFSRVTQQLADYHHLVVSVMVAIEPRSIPMSKQGKIMYSQMLLQSVVQLREFFPYSGQN